MAHGEEAYEDAEISFGFSAMEIDSLGAPLEGDGVAFECEDDWSNVEEAEETREDYDTTQRGFGGLRATMADVCEMPLQPSDSRSPKVEFQVELSEPEEGSGSETETTRQQPSDVWVPGANAGEC